HELAGVPAADVQAHVITQQAVFALDRRRPLSDADVGDRGERDVRHAAWHRYQHGQLAQRFVVLAEGPGVADADRVAFPALHRGGHDLAALGDFDAVAV